MHNAYTKTVPGSAGAVLMIHGIAGSPNHFKPLLSVIPDSWSVYNILLDGHGKTVQDFSATSMEKWKQQVQTTVEDLLQQHEQLVIVAHSMGTLFSVQAALDHPQRIKGMLLMSIPLRPRVRFCAMIGGLCVALGKTTNNKTAAAMAAASSITPDRRLYRYLFWLPRFAELLQEIRRIRTLLPQLRVQTEVYLARNDELVSGRTARDLQNHPYIHSTLLRDSGHFSYSKEDMQQMCSCLEQLLNK